MYVSDYQVLYRRFNSQTSYFKIEQRITPPDESVWRITQLASFQSIVLATDAF